MLSTSAITNGLSRLRENLCELEKVVVAFSGGADSAFLAWVASDTLGVEKAKIVTAVSPSLASDERSDASLLATEWGLDWMEIETQEMDSVAYQANDIHRCAHCKDALMDALEPLATELAASVVLGVNIDDLGDYRPGQEVAASRGARFPLVETQFTKMQVREASRHLGLRTWNKPAAACLASRIPYGTKVEIAVLTAVERAEASLKRLGFDTLRVRHYESLARIEVPVDRLSEVVERRGEVVRAVSAAGYRWVTLDLEGFRSGNLNNL